MPSSAQERFAAALTEVHDALDWSLLGELYCESGGADFFPPEQVDAIAEAGLLLASEVGEALQAAGARGPGRSLYVGAAVAELGPMLCEALVMGRDVVAVNLDNPETAELNRVLARVGESLGFALPHIQTSPWEPVDVGRCQHVWLVSVLTDPTDFPALHDELYQRSGTPLATQRGHLPTELANGRALVRRVLECAAPGGCVTTTDEELPVVAEQCTRRGWRLEVPEAARLSPIVGDPVRTCGIVALGDGPAAPGEG